MDILTHKSPFLHTPNPVDYLFSQSSGHFSIYLPFHPSDSFVSDIAASDSEDDVINRPNEQCVEDSSEWSTASRFTERLLSMCGIGQLHQQVTIGTLPGDVLLQIFKLFVDAMYSYYTASEKWCTLVHVCRRWRQLAFTSPCHLNLQLFCKPPRRPVNKMLEVWPELPVYLHAFDYPYKEDRDKVAAAFRLNHRVSGIRLERTSDSAWETFAPLMQHPFPVLTHLWVEPRLSITNPISRSFLGGSAPCLKDLVLVGVPLPALPELLLSATHLVRLWYDNIPHSGYIPPQAMVTGLSALTRLESLSLTFLSLQDLPERSIRDPPPHTRILLPAFTNLRFLGASEYMEVLATQIDAPSLESLETTLFYQGVLEVSELGKFVRRADKLSLVDRAKVTFKPDYISVKLSQELLAGRIDPNTLMLKPSLPEWDFRPLNLAKFCASLFPTYPPFECLEIAVPFMWQDVIDDPDPQWLELLRLFNTVKHLRLYGPVTSRVFKLLRGLPVEQFMEVLPALEIVFIPDLDYLGPVKEDISVFIDARQLSGHPVSIHY